MKNERHQPQNIIVTGLIPKDIIDSHYFWNYQVSKMLKLQTKDTDNCKYKVYFIRSICDLPARSIALCINNHGGYYPCNMCNIEGRFIDGTVKYPSTSDSKKVRTEDEYKEIVDKLSSLFQKGNLDTTVAGFQNITPFSALGFGEQKFNPRIFSINDIMHTVFEGHFIQLFNIWVTNKTSFLKKVDYIWLQQTLPSWFKRNPRSFEKYRKYLKAKEWMMFFFFYFSIIEHLFTADETQKREFIFVSAMIKTVYTLSFPCTVDVIDKCERILYLYHIWFKNTHGEVNCTLKTHFLLHLADTVR